MPESLRSGPNTKKKKRNVWNASKSRLFTRSSNKIPLCCIKKKKKETWRDDEESFFRDEKQDLDLSDTLKVQKGEDFLDTRLDGFDVFFSSASFFLLRWYYDDGGLFMRCVFFFWKGAIELLLILMEGSSGDEWALQRYLQLNGVQLASLELRWMVNDVWGYPVSLWAFWLFSWSMDLSFFRRIDWWS